MPARTFDWRDDPMGTAVAVPEVRARFIRAEPGEKLGNFHSHEESDGIEVWVVLEGAVRFEIEDETVIATAGQAVVAWPHEKAPCHLCRRRAGGVLPDRHAAPLTHPHALRRGGPPAAPNPRRRRADLAGRAGARRGVVGRPPYGPSQG